MMFLILSLFGQLSLPPEIRGEVAGFVTVTATTEGKLVRFMPLDVGLNVFPSNLLADPKSTVVSAAVPGRYRLLAYSSVADVPTPPAITTIIIGQPKPDPGPQPDQLATALKGILGGLQEQGQADQLSRLIETYRQGETIAADHAIQTTENLYQALVKARKTAGVRDGALTAVRERIAQEWAASMGTVDVPLSPVLRDRAIHLCARIRSALESCR
jgi:hypothetical protein